VTFDTNTLLQTQGNILENFNNIILPIGVIEELDNQKSKEGSLGYNARCVIRKLEKREDIQYITKQKYIMPEDWITDKIDNQIVCFARDNDCILYCNDLNVRTKAKSLNIPAFAWVENKTEHFKGWRKLILTEEQIADFYENKNLPVNNFIENEYIILFTEDGKSIEKLKYKNGDLKKIQRLKYKDTYIEKPLDDIQYCAYDALFDDDIKIVSLTGLSGTGKTKTAVSVGLELLNNQNSKYEKIVLIRHAVESGETIGLLPGDKNEKLINGWAGCFYDNLPGKKFEFMENLYENKIEIETLSLLKGRDLKNCFIIFDECEDAFPEQIELVATRKSSGSKVVFVGDYNQTSHQKYKNNNGLKKLIEKCTGQSWFTNLELQTNGRDEIVEFFATEFKK